MTDHGKYAELVEASDGCLQAAEFVDAEGPKERTKIFWGAYWRLNSALVALEAGDE